MTIVVGQIEPLKKLKNILTSKGIERFSSIGDINNFLKNYDSEKKKIPIVVESSFAEEISQLETNSKECQQLLDDLKKKVLAELNQEIIQVKEKYDEALESYNKNIINRLLFFIKVNSLKRKVISLEKNLENTTRKKTRHLERRFSEIKIKLDDYRNSKDIIISSRCADLNRELDFTKEVVDGLYTLIAGAVGESATVNELCKLSDEYYLINDFSAEFNPPIYNKKEADRIHSVQIDHLLICRSGLFLLETKNWSDESVKNIDLRSPVQQIMRTSYALFILLNGDSNIALKQHHWGSKKIPIRNIIVMTNKKPKEEFKHVKVLSLAQLNGYVEYFDKIFSHDEVKEIFDHLKI